MSVHRLSACGTYTQPNVATLVPSAQRVPVGDHGPYHVLWASRIAYSRRLLFLMQREQTIINAEKNRQLSTKDGIQLVRLTLISFERARKFLIETSGAAIKYSVTWNCAHRDMHCTENIWRQSRMEAIDKCFRFFHIICTRYIGLVNWNIGFNQSEENHLPIGAYERREFLMKSLDPWDFWQPFIITLMQYETWRRNAGRSQQSMFKIVMCYSTVIGYNYIYNIYIYNIY